MSQKKYKTAAALKKAVDAYFNSVSHTEYVLRPDEDGSVRRVRSDDGSFLSKREFYIPPSISALCLFLGISRQTWSIYSDTENSPDFADVCEYAKLIIAAYLEEQLLQRRKGVQGIIFNLKNNYGWSEKADISATEKPAAKNELDGMSLDEKLALIVEAAHLLGDNNDTTEQ